MRTKLLSALLLASTALAGVASADPIIRDHRYQPAYQQPTVTVRTRQPQRYYTGRVAVTARPSWMANVNYGFQVDNDGDEVQPYTYGNDPYVEGIARGEWVALAGWTRLAYNQDSKINVSGNGMPMRSLELQAVGGGSLIREVHVELNDGREIKLTPNRAISVTHEPNLRIDLGGSAMVGVRNIEIFGYSTGKGAFNVLGA